MTTSPRVTRTENTFTMTIPCRAVGKGAIRHDSKTGRHFLEERTADFMALVRDLSAAALPPEPWLGPVEGEITVFFAPPPSWPAARRAAALRDELRPDQAPDLDNLSKAILDSLQPTRPRPPALKGGPPRPPRFPRGLLRNDGQVTDLVLRKRYGDEDMILVSLVRLDLGRGLTPTQPSLL